MCKQEIILPTWIPQSVGHYLHHTELGVPIRRLARRAACSASTVLRQIRKIEAQRDDPLVDAALSRLAVSGTKHGSLTGEQQEGSEMQTEQVNDVPALPEKGELTREAVRVLRRLCEPGALLAVAEQMEKAVVVRDDENGSPRTATVEATIAQAMALKGWIACDNPGRISRYFITSSGRKALSRLLAEQENRIRAERETGFAEAPGHFISGFGDLEARGGDDDEARRHKRVRYNVTESPLTCLSRRRDRDGERFLSDVQVRAGERLREDFELAQMGSRGGQNWEQFLSGGARGQLAPDQGMSPGAAAARDRVARALVELGPGLSEISLRCCCFLEGLESAEKRLGWSARSGKIVLRIALQRLSRYYEEQAAPDQMIG